jgi:exodeoxyribonuclease VII large subunit
MTVAELVAFRNAITPTELADFLLQTFHDFSVPIKDAGKSLRVYSNRLLEMHSQHFSAETKHFKNSANLYLNASKNKLVQKSQHFNAEAKTLILRKREALHFAQKESIAHTKRFFKVEKEQVLGFQLELPQKFKAILDSEKRNVLQAENMVNLMNPKNVLKRGYSITTVNGKTVHGEMAIQAGDFIQTKTYDLEIESIVQKISKHEE